jgi:putative membrane protein
LSAYTLVQATLFLVVLILGSIPGVRRALTPPALKRHHVHAAAAQHFAVARMHLQPGEAVVMIFAALGERQVEILADETIHAKVGQAAWDRAVAEAIAAIRADGVASGLVRAVEICGEALASAFPADGRGNALPDRPLEI